MTKSMENSLNYIAQFNYGVLRKPIDDPVNIDFVDALDEINLKGESAPGFIWRLKKEENEVTTIFEGDSSGKTIVNLSVWSSISSLYEFTYGSDHAIYFKRRREWFEKSSIPTLVLWWLPDRNFPTVDQGFEKLKYLQDHGPSNFAFTFKDQYPKN